MKWEYYKSVIIWAFYKSVIICGLYNTEIICAFYKSVITKDTRNHRSYQHEMFLVLNREPTMATNGWGGRKPMVDEWIINGFILFLPISGWPDWAIFRPLGGFLLDKYFEKLTSCPMFGLLFPLYFVLISTINGPGYILINFFTNSSGHPGQYPNVMTYALAVAISRIYS
jgi:hypothetical protein